MNSYFAAVSCLTRARGRLFTAPKGAQNKPEKGAKQARGGAQNKPVEGLTTTKAA